jgi:hypothetical protein
VVVLALLYEVEFVSLKGRPRRRCGTDELIEGAVGSDADP